MEINLIWQTPEGEYTSFEFEYITEILFKNFKQNRFFDNGSYETILDNSVIIYSKDNEDKTPISEDFIKYLDKFVDKKYNFYLVHLSNEHKGHDCWYYEKANYVFRNYYYDEIKNSNIKYIPLGFKSGFLNKNTDIDKKKNIIFTFIGMPYKQDRIEMVNIIKKYRSFLHLTNRWNCPTALKPKEISDLYEITKFVPCPMGNVHVDSFRITECLESKSVPIVKLYNNEDYFQNIFPNHPFPTVKSWEELHQINEIYSDEKNYKELLEKVNSYYDEFKNELASSIYKIINNK